MSYKSSRSKKGQQEIQVGGYIRISKRKKPVVWDEDEKKKFNASHGQTNKADSSKISAFHPHPSQK